MLPNCHCALHSTKLPEAFWAYLDSQDSHTVVAAFCGSKFLCLCSDWYQQKVSRFCFSYFADLRCDAPIHMQVREKTKQLENDYLLHSRSNDLRLPYI